MRNFKQLKIWQKGIVIASKAFALVKSFPREERFGLSVQITKAAISIPSNIAEGSSRSSEKEYGRFLEISLGSTFELETQLLIAEDIGYGEPKLIAELLHIVGEEQKMLMALDKKLKQRSLSS